MAKKQAFVMKIFATKTLCRCGDKVDPSNIKLNQCPYLLVDLKTLNNF